MHRPFCPEHLFHHGNVTGILESFINVVADEIKKGGQLGITVFSGEFVVAFGETVQERQDVIGGNIIDGMITKFMAKFADSKFIRPCRIFFWILPGDTRENSSLPVKISFWAPFRLRLGINWLYDVSQ